MSEKEYCDILEEIESLPSGGITYKKINGKDYAYYQWRENELYHFIYQCIYNFLIKNQK